MLNRIVTKGMGPSRGVVGRSSMVVHGYGGKVPEFVPEVLAEVVPRRYGGSTTDHRRKEALETILVWAKLVEVNGRQPSVKIVGQTSKSVADSHRRVMVEYVGSKLNKAYDSLLVTFKWIKRS